MDPFVTEKDFEALSQDQYTFAVLDRILRESCDLVMTDHRRLILCHSGRRFPVWIWTPDGLREEEKEQAWKLSEECRPLKEGYRYNMKYELADYFVHRARQAGLEAGITMQLYAYDCPSPIPPDAPADGEIHECVQQDLEEAAAFIPLFYTEIGEEPPSREYCLEKAQAYIGEHAFFFWMNASGKAVACCSYKVNQGLASLGSVFTLPECRRKHYARHLVYQVTKRVKDLGWMPMLYTDANYPASNACYEKIGYVLRGKLCTVAALKQ